MLPKPLDFLRNWHLYILENIPYDADLGLTEVEKGVRIGIQRGHWPSTGDTTSKNYTYIMCSRFIESYRKDVLVQF